MRPFLFLGLGLLAAGVASGASLQFASSDAPTTLVELFTSEGCSSCPPADRWLGSLRSAPGLWRDFVPVSFHVDYWNRLGWPDRFATRAFTEREYGYAAAWKSDGVYTPCVVANGAESHAGRLPAPATAKAGRLTATYDGTSVRVDFSPAPADLGQAFEVHAAILGSGIVSKVTAGENGGATLAHEFVALTLVHGAPGRALPLKAPAISGVPRHALAVWATRRGELVPLQATGGWLD